MLEKNLKKPKVSVIIPTHNRGEMLRRAIDSVLNQTYKDFELIVISDGCTDNTDEIVASYADPRIKFFSHEKSRGTSAARNTGIRASTGQYVAFLDDDDEWTPKKLELQMPIIENSPLEVGLVYTWMDYLFHGKSIAVHAPRLRGNVFENMLDKQALGGCPTIIIKHEVLDRVDGFNENLPRGNDADFIRRITKYYHVDYVPKILAKIHVGHPDRISVHSRESALNAIKELENRLHVFEEDFIKHRKAWSNVLFQIGIYYIKSGMPFKGLIHVVRAILKNPLNNRIYTFLPMFVVHRFANIFHPKIYTNVCDKS
jgi:glycosyltransferase involved in cell wall biosynthesis